MLKEGFARYTCHTRRNASLDKKTNPPSLGTMRKLHLWSNEAIWDYFSSTFDMDEASRRVI
jgi:hypothetical protein